MGTDKGTADTEGPVAQLHQCLRQPALLLGRQFGALMGQIKLVADLTIRRLDVGGFNVVSFV